MNRSAADWLCRGCWRRRRKCRRAGWLRVRSAEEVGERELAQSGRGLQRRLVGDVRGDDLHLELVGPDVLDGGQLVLQRSGVGRGVGQGALHLLSNSTYPILLLVGIINPLVVVIAHQHHIRIAWPISAYFIFSLFGTYSYHAEAERALHKDWLKRMLYFPAFLAQSIGMSVNNAKAALEAWLGIKSGFVRTPKYDLTRRGQRWHKLEYRSRFSATRT